MNDNTTLNTFIQPIKSLNKISQKPVNEVFYSKDCPFIIEAMHRSDSEEIKSHSKTRQSIRHYNKYRYQHSDLSDNDEQINEIDSEKCPLEDILNDRFIR